MIDKDQNFSEYGERPRDGMLILHHERIVDNLETLAPVYADLNTVAFALEDPTDVTEAMQRLCNTDLLLFALDGRNEPVGFATYQFVPSEMGRVVYQARGLAPAARGFGFGKKFPQAAVRELRADFLIAKAQNPISIWSTISTGLFESVQPIHADFNTSPEMAHVLADTVLARGKLGEVDLNTGVHRASYPMGKLGDYEPNFDHPGVAAVQARLLELGVNAANGDAIYYGGKIV